MTLASPNDVSLASDRASVSFLKAHRSPSGISRVGLNQLLLYFFFGVFWESLQPFSGCGIDGFVLPFRLALWEIPVSCMQLMVLITANLILVLTCSGVGSRPAHRRFRFQRECDRLVEANDFYAREQNVARCDSHELGFERGG
jgi:hypothetical protein